MAIVIRGVARTVVMCKHLKKPGVEGGGGGGRGGGGRGGRGSPPPSGGGGS